MQYSGYSKKFRYEFVDSALKVYKTRNEVDEEGERPLHRPKEWRKDERERLTFAMLTSSSREELDHFIASVNSFHLALKYTWKIYEIQSLFSTSKTQSIATVYQPVCSTNLQIPTVICCIHPLILPMTKTPSRSLINFVDFRLPTNQRKCVISSRIVTILILKL